jgi:nitronate monooxygenase
MTMIGDPSLAPRLKVALRLPVMAAPMYIASTPELVIAQCKAGIIGSIPALNARTPEQLEQFLTAIEAGLAGCPVPYAVNIVAHRTNERLESDLAIVLRHRVPIVVLALAARADIIEAVHAYGGLVFNDVVNVRQARKCAGLGIDGIVAVAAGAGGHTGSVSPFALVEEIREWWQGPLALAGSIANGRAILAAEALGADFAYIGSPFLATTEANTQDAFRQMIVDGDSSDVVLTNCFTGATAAFLRPSLIANGLDPANLVRPEGAGVNIAGGGSDKRAWRDIWSAGQGIGAVKHVAGAGDYIAHLVDDYARARAAMMARP